MISTTIPNELAGTRLDTALARILPDYSRTMLAKWLADGIILINGETRPQRYKVQGGELVTFTSTPESGHLETDQPEAIPLDIIYEDKALIVINKPAGMVVHKGAGNPDHTLVNALLHHDINLQNLPRAGIIHRLDKDTTGLMLIAKTLPAYKHLTEALAARDIKRTYKALVHGHLISGGTIQTAYGRSPQNRLKMAVLKNGKRNAHTIYRIAQQFGALTLLDVSLVTGRTHQIRVHMAHIRHPIVGDPLYGGRNRLPAQCSEALKTALTNFKRQALHAGHIGLLHPVTDEQLEFSAPLPDDFQHLLDLLG